MAANTGIYRHSVGKVTVRPSNIVIIETKGVFVYSAERCNIKAEHEEELDDMQEARSHFLMQKS